MVRATISVGSRTKHRQCVRRTHWFNRRVEPLVRAHKHHFISVADKQTQDTFSAIANYIAFLADKPQEEIAHFLSQADPWIIAKAATLGATVVTHERRVADNSRKIKIPNICEIFSVSYMNTFSVLKKLEARFVLGQ